MYELGDSVNIFCAHTFVKSISLEVLSDEDWLILMLTLITMF